MSDDLMHEFDPAFAQTEAEKLLLEWYEQWEDRDDMPAKMDNSLHVRTAVYWVLKTYGVRDPAATVEEVPGHHIEFELILGDRWGQLTCECNWTSVTTVEIVEQDKQLHWIAKQVEADVLGGS